MKVFDPLIQYKFVDLFVFWLSSLKQKVWKLFKWEKFSMFILRNQDQNTNIISIWIFCLTLFFHGPAKMLIRIVVERIP